MNKKDQVEQKKEDTVDPINFIRWLKGYLDGIQDLKETINLADYESIVINQIANKLNRIDLPCNMLLVPHTYTYSTSSSNQVNNIEDSGYAYMGDDKEL